MSLLKSLAGLLSAFLLPPLSVGLSRGMRFWFWMALVLFVVGQAVFWLLYAGPGLLLWAASILLALILWALLPFRRRRPA